MPEMNSRLVRQILGFLGAALVGAALLTGPVRADSGSPPPAVPAPASLQASGQVRPEAWAVPVTDKVGLPNLFKVSDVLYRGGQPKRRGYAQLKAMGIKTVVDLRVLHSERDKCRKHGLNCVRLPQITFAEKMPDVIDFLRAVTDCRNQPVFVHCHHGSDRTGAMIAAYRVVIQGWPKEEAIREMTGGGYGFHPLWKNLIKFIRDLNVEEIRKNLGPNG